MARYLRVDRQDLENWPEIVEILWHCDTLPLVWALEPSFVFVPEAHPGIEFILLRLDQAVWYDHPVQDARPEEIRFFS